MQSPENSQNFNRYAYCLNNPLKYTDPDGETFITAAVIITGALIGAYTGGALANDGNYNIAEWDSPGTAAGIIFGGVAGALSSWCAGAIAGTGISFCNTIAMASSSLVYSSGMYATGMLAGFDYDITLNLGVGSISYSPNDGEWNGGSLFDFEHNEWQDYVSYGLGLASNLTDLHRFATWGCLSKAKKLEIIKENLSDKSIKVTYDRTISGEGDYNKSTNEIRIGRKGLRRGKGWANSTIEHENQHSVDRNKGLGKKDNDLLDFRAYNEELRNAEENGLSPAQHQELIKRSKDCANNLGLKTGAYPKYTLKEWLRSFLLR